MGRDLRGVRAAQGHRRAAGDEDGGGLLRPARGGTEPARHAPDAQGHDSEYTRELRDLFRRAYLYGFVNNRDEQPPGDGSLVVSTTHGDLRYQPQRVTDDQQDHLDYTPVNRDDEQPPDGNDWADFIDDPIIDDYPEDDDPE